MIQERRPIARLSPDVVGKIAAGEVVERPAAAIKELVENSIDAGASAVTIEIKDGGIRYFRVTDNGCGIPSADIRMAFERHATSKITHSEDLNRIATLGFRGEALASIAAVSRMTCTTRTRQEDHGLTAVNEGGQILEIKEAACPEGTTFIVRDLFFNTPVRLKFLKKPSYEASLVSDLVMRMILSNPSVSFRFINQGKVVYHSAGNGDMASAVYSIYGKEMLKSMRYIKDQAGGILLEGYVGIGESARGNRSHQSFFINGRYMKNSVLAQALETACKERVTIGHFPSCVLHLTMPYEQVDVNVHPNKLEVRFQNDRLVFDSMVAMISQVLNQDTPFKQIPEMTLQPKQSENENRPRIEVKKVDQIPTSVSDVPPKVYQAPRATHASPVSISQRPVMRESSFVPGFIEPKPQVILPVSKEQPVPLKERQTYHQQKELPVLSDSTVKTAQTVEEISLLDQPAIQNKLSKPVKIIGVVFHTFILAEYDDQLLLIDQHAVHERILYDKMMKAFDQKTASQALLIPQAIELTHHEMEIFQANQQALQEAGFEVEIFDSKTILLRGVPMILGIPQAKGTLMDIIDQLDGLKALTTLEKRRNAILQMACKKAIKGGDTLTDAEVEDLVNQMSEKGITPTCPHGRPLVVAISHTELDKRFKRIQ
ncbi:MAG: DNA mismatch repair endonuclease MutL [Clostridia bacterium]|nr:DNA mismatch repair endonuclease MutL [Clostridia bacterium]